MMIGMLAEPGQQGAPIVDLRAFVTSTSFFGGLDAKTVDALLSMLKEHRVAAGQTLFCEGDTANSMYIVREGALVMQRHCSVAPDDEARLLMMRPGDFFGVTSLIEMEPRPFSCVAEKDSLIYELTNRDLYTLYKSDQKAYVLVLQNINRELCRRIRKAGDRIASLEHSLRVAHADCRSPEPKPR